MSVSAASLLLLVLVAVGKDTQPCIPMWSGCNMLYSSTPCCGRLDLELAKSEFSGTFCNMGGAAAGHFGYEEGCCQSCGVGDDGCTADPCCPCHDPQKNDTCPKGQHLCAFIERGRNAIQQPSCYTDGMWCDTVDLKCCNGASCVRNVSSFGSLSTSGVCRRDEEFWGDLPVPPTIPEGFPSTLPAPGCANYVPTPSPPVTLATDTSLETTLESTQSPMQTTPEASVTDSTNNITTLAFETTSIVPSTSSTPTTVAHSYETTPEPTPHEISTSREEVTPEATDEPSTSSQKFTPEATDDPSTSSQEVTPEATDEPSTSSQEVTPEATDDPSTSSQEVTPEATDDPSTSSQEITPEATDDPSTSSQEITPELAVDTADQDSTTSASSATTESACAAVEESCDYIECCDGLECPGYWGLPWLLNMWGMWSKVCQVGDG